MCAIIGALVWNLNSAERVDAANELMHHIMTESHNRGRDGRGYMVNSSTTGLFSCVRSTTKMDATKFNMSNSGQYFGMCQSSVMIGNTRAEPTTEYVKEKSIDDQQPYWNQGWWVVHNGTIANDKQLRTNKISTQIDSAAIPETLAKIAEDLSLNHFAVFKHAVDQLKGSYAIISNHLSRTDEILLATNYRPIWYIRTNVGVFFASAKEFFPEDTRSVPEMIEPFTISRIAIDDYSSEDLTFNQVAVPRKANDDVLVVCSGGLDSVVAAQAIKRYGFNVTLLHFLYGCRAEDKEKQAIHNIADHMGVKRVFLRVPNVYKDSDSPILNNDEEIADGESGAEFAHEWVPARNLLMLSIATAYAEANNYSYIAIGANLEEAGAYPDNEHEFVKRFDELLAFAVRPDKQIQLLAPVADLMKHEIVALGNELDAPMHLTWSCYQYGDKHCGKCGPCMMRRTAFEMNQLDEVIEYEDQPTPKENANASC